MNKNLNEAHFDKKKFGSFYLLNNSYFWIVGFVSFLWVILRSGTNPKRLAYPCQQAAYPLASAWLLALLAILGGSYFLQRLWKVSGYLVVLIVFSWLFLSFNTQRTDVFISTSSALAEDFPVWTSSDETSKVYLLSRMPLTPGSLALGNASVSDAYLSDPAIDSIVLIMEKRGEYFHKTSLHPEGIIGVNDVVIIKANFQWRHRMGTNTDRIKGVIWQVLNHPDGFNGEILVCDNGESQIWPESWLAGFSDNSNNSEDLDQSIVDVVNTFKSKGYPVDYFVWDDLNTATVSEYEDGDMINGYIFNPTTLTSYPKFITPGGNYVSLKNGIWNTTSEVYNKDLLSIINMPVLKAHGIVGATIAVKNYIGVMNTTKASEWFGGDNVDDAFHPTYCFSEYALVAREIDICWPKLNIVDATWTAIESNYNFNTTSVRTNTVLASTDPVAVSWYAAKYILQPIALNPSRVNPENISGSSQDYGQVLDYWYNYLINNTSRQVSKDSVNISVFGRESLVSSPVILLETINITSESGVNTIDSYHGTLQLGTNVLPKDAADTTVSWSILNLSGIAEISELGLVSALSNGIVRAVAIANDESSITDTFEIALTNQEILIESINITSEGGVSEIDSYHGALQLGTNIIPKDASDTTVSWSIVNLSGVAEVSGSGLVTAISNGIVKVVARANDESSITDTFNIILSNQGILVESLFVTSEGDVNVIDSYRGTLQLGTYVLPKNATDTTINWRVLNITGEADVSETGLVLAYKDGTVKVIAKAMDGSAITDTISLTLLNQGLTLESINITSPGGINEINENQGKLQLGTIVYPSNAADTTVTWSISNITGSAIISESGLVSAISDGTVRVFANANDQLNLYDSLDVFITNQYVFVDSLSIYTENNNYNFFLDEMFVRFYSKVFPSTSTDTTIEWTVEEISGKAAIDDNGLLELIGVGEVNVLAMANGGINIKQEARINILEQSNANKLISNDNKLRIYPNPVKDYLYVNYFGIYDTEVTVELFNLANQLVYSQDYMLDNEIITIDLKSFSIGVYFIRLRNKNELLFQNIIYHLNSF